MSIVPRDPAYVPLVSFDCAFGMSQRTVTSGVHDMREYGMLMLRKLQCLAEESEAGTITSQALGALAAQEVKLVDDSGMMPVGRKKLGDESP